MASSSLPLPFCLVLTSACFRSTFRSTIRHAHRSRSPARRFVRLYIHRPSPFPPSACPFDDNQDGHRTLLCQPRSRTLDRFLRLGHDERQRVHQRNCQLVGDDGRRDQGQARCLAQGESFPAARPFSTPPGQLAYFDLSRDLLQFVGPNASQTRLCGHLERRLCEQGGHARRSRSLPGRLAQILQEMSDGALLLPLLSCIQSTHTDTFETPVT